MEFVITLLSQQPLMTLFLTVGIGYLLGEVNVKGFSLGAGAVLFVALFVGWLAPNSAPAPLVGTLGLALFLYCVGIQYGKLFFVGLVSRGGQKANLLSLIALIVAGALSLALMELFGLKLGYALGIFAGSGTSTPTLQAAISSVGNNDPAVGYSSAYPFGVAGPILVMYLAVLLFKPKIEAPKGAALEVLEIAIRNPELFGKRLGDMLPMLPSETDVVAFREEHQNKFPHPDLILDEDDVVLVTATSKAVLEEARKILGEAAPGRIARDRSAMDYIRVFASKRTVVGMELGELKIPGGFDYQFTQISRGDSDLLPRRDLIVEFGDRVGLLVNRANIPAVRAFFGDSIKGTADFSYISIGLGMALGLLVGLIPLPIPGVGKLTLGFAGLLLTALVLGYYRRTGGLHWTIPLSANLVLRNLGLTIFLAQVGISSGPKFAAAVAESGFLLIFVGVLVLLGLVLPVMLIGLRVLKLPFDEVCGIVSGVTGNPAILNYASKLTGTEKPDVGYAMIFPGATILKILFVQIGAAILRG
jgi:putative transport protein